jgi:opacity protein-like surface antigen
MSPTTPVIKILGAAAPVKNRSITFQTFRAISVAIFMAIGSIPIICSGGSANQLTSSLATPSSRRIAQTPDAERQRQLDNQRDAERVLKEGERLKREVRDNNGYNDRGLRQQVGEQVNKVRESGSNPQTVREAEAELNRLRQQNNHRYPSYYNPFYYPNYITAPIIFAPGFYNYPSSPAPSNSAPAPAQPPNRIVQNDAPSDPNASELGFLISSGFKDGKIAPGIGVKYKNIGFEIAGIFNQDSLPGAVNDFSLPSNFLFNDLGKKKLSAQWGADVLGFLDVDPRISVYGSVGLYFQNISRIAQSQATNDLYKQTDETETTGAIGGGVNYRASDKIDVGIGYHSLRGLTARIGISF